MTLASSELLAPLLWRQTLEKFGAVTHLTVALYDLEANRIGEPVPPTPLFDALARRGFELGAFTDCARRCVAQVSERPAVVIAAEYGLGVVGTSLVLAGEVVGAAVAGYVLVDFPSVAAIERLSRSAGAQFRELWEIARQQAPVPLRRLSLGGELLQVLGDSLLGETHRARQLEETAARLQHEAAAKDEFLAVLSHELRTPLSPILNWARVLADRCGDQDACRRAASAIERSARLQAKLVDDLLDFSRVTRRTIVLEKGPCALGSLLRTAVESTAEAAATKNVTVELAEIGEVIVDGDAARLQQVFLNVLSNGIKFTPAGGTVRVSSMRGADAVTVSIADTGEGISPEFMPHVFEMFKQQESGTRRRHSGLGIGLALVKRLVDLHHGGIEVQSGGNEQGTTVAIRLPLVAPRSSAAPAPGRELTAGRPTRPLADLTILVVEDTPETLESTSALLELLGARVLRASDGQDALEVLARSRADIVLCDLRMPRMDGFEFLHELDRREGVGRPPVVAVSGLGSSADRRRTEQAGFAGHLVKPVDDLALVAAVRATSRATPSVGSQQHPS